MRHHTHNSEIGSIFQVPSRSNHQELSLAALALTTANAGMPTGRSNSLGSNLAELIDSLGIRLSRLRRRIRVSSKRHLRRARAAIHARHLKEQKRRQLRDHARTPQINQLLALEPRIVFDAAIAATVEQTADDAAAKQAHAAVQAAAHTASDSLPGSNSPDAISCFDWSDVDPAFAGQELPTGIKECIVIDPSAKNPGASTSMISDGAEVFVLDANRDGLSQIGDFLKDTKEPTNLHIVTDIEGGKVKLGNITHNVFDFARRSGNWTGMSRRARNRRNRQPHRQRHHANRRTHQGHRFKHRQRR